MGDLISRSRMLDSLHREDTRLIGGNHYVRLSAVQEKIRIAPTVDAVQVVHGRWVHFKQHDPNAVFCSACDYAFARLHPANYCPNCGAKMDAKEDKSCE